MLEEILQAEEEYVRKKYGSNQKNEENTVLLKYTHYKIRKENEKVSTRDDISTHSLLKE